jgi:hypothetical protein
MNSLLDPEAAKLIQALYSELGTWRAVEAQTGINSGLLWQVAHGKCRSDKTRKALGLLPRFVPVPPCADCGVVHTQHKTCNTERVGRERGPRYTGDTAFAPDIAAEARRRKLTNGEFLEWMWTIYQLEQIK